MGADLSRVRVHSDTRSQQAANEINAKAFTNKNNVHLGAGQSSTDIALMSHELTHVLQQGAVIRRKPAKDELLEKILTSAEFLQQPFAATAGTTSKKTPPFSRESKSEEEPARNRQKGEAADTGAVERIDNVMPPPATPTSGEVVGTNAPSSENRPQPAPQAVVENGEEFSTRLAANEVPDIQSAWYNFDIPFTDYQFDPSIRGVKNAVGIARDTVVDSATWVRDRAVEAFQWVYDKIEGLVNSGIEWLNNKFDAIKEFAKSSFDSVKNGLKSLTGLITSPASMLTTALIGMNVGLIKMAWNSLKTGANAVWKGTKAIIDGVLRIGTGLWDTASGFVSGLFSKIDAVINSWAFRQLPDFLQRGARALYNRIKSLWNTIKNFITDLLKRLRKFCSDILNAIESFVQQVVGYGIQAVLDAVQAISDGWDLVKRVAADPEGYIRPYIHQLAAKINSDTPPKAVQLGEENSQKNLPSESAGGNAVIQRQSSSATPARSTASLTEVKDGFVAAISNAWSQLDIGKMLWETVVNMFWPPATIRAIGHEFYELWTKDWANAAGSLFAPRAPWNDFFGFFHDLWSNFLILLDFPLALWRRLNSVLMLLMGYVTLIAVIVGAVVGAVGGEGVGAIPGALAGLAAVAPIGEALLASYFAAELLTVEKTLLELFTARQTQEQKNLDYVQLAGSLIGMAIALVLVAIIWLLSEFISAVVRMVKGRGAPEPTMAAETVGGEPVETAEPTRAPAEEGTMRPGEEPVAEPTLSGRRPAVPESPVLDESGNLTTYGEWYYERPGNYRTNTKAEVWEEAASQSPDGIVRDPISGEEISPEAFRMEEKPGHDFASRQRAAAERGARRGEFLDEYNNPEHYRPREPRPSSAEFSGPRPSSPEQPVLDIEGNLTDYGRWYYERPSGFREGIRETVWEEAQANSIDGVVRDPVTLEEISPNEPWDMGHRPGYEFRKHRASAARRGISRETFLDEHNNPSHYRPEKPLANRGHQGEAPEDVYFGP